MAQHVIIDGNNLWHAMIAHAPVPCVGRETLVKIIEQWARGGQDAVTLVFDGPVPRAGLAKQMSSSRIKVRFSAPETADDIIVRLTERATDPGIVRVISDDTAIGHAARMRRCRHCGSTAFVAELYPSARRNAEPADETLPDKPDGVSEDEAEQWLETFGLDSESDEEPFDGYNAMMP